MWNLLRRSLKMGCLTEEIQQEQTETEPLAGEAHYVRKKFLSGRSFHIRHLDCGSCNGCDWEMTALLNPVYDIQRLGLDFVASPRHADVLMCTGPVSTQLLQAALATYEAAPHPKIVVAVGDCAINGGVFQEAYATQQGVGKVLPVDIMIPGCPPSPSDMLNALLKALGSSPYKK